VDDIALKTPDVTKRRKFSPFQEAVANPSLLVLLKELRSELRGLKTVLDVGCGSLSPMRFIGGCHLAGIDGFRPALEEAQKHRTHDEYFFGDVRQLGKVFGTRRFDACVALDLIEHLPKDDGFQLLQSMESLATRRVVIFTPNGFLPQRSRNGDLQEHLSGWTTEELRARGYEVFGMYGPKSFRGEYHQIKARPKFFWVSLSLACHFGYTRRHPEHSAAIFCVKRLG
jgi:SAM-dependent methyltransferase